MAAERYTHMQHNIRKHFGLSMEQYAVLDAIYCLSRNQACEAKAQYYVDLFDISERSYYNIIKDLKNKLLIEKHKTGLRTTRVWDEAMEGRVAPWVDPSEKTAKPATDDPEKPMEESPAAELPVTAEFAVCPECAKSLQKLQSVDFVTAKNAVNHCKNCSKALQKLQKTTAKNAVLNIVINTVIDNNNNNTAPLANQVVNEFSGQVIAEQKALAPAGAGTPFHAIDEIFIAGSTTLTGEPYYKDAKEARQIKLLGPRFEKDPDKFLNDTRKFYWLITKSGDAFWMSQPFTPSAFNSLYNRILGYKPAVDTVRREERKGKTDDELFIEKYSSCSKSDLDYLLKANVICKQDYDMLVKRLPLEATA